MKLLQSLLILKYLGLVISICVLDKKKGWWLDCGLRDSYLFRLKNIGGVQANFNLGFGIGDEKGFPNSISKTSGKKHHVPHSTANKYGSPYSHYPPQQYKNFNQYGNPNRRDEFPYQYEVPSASSRGVQMNNNKWTPSNQKPYFNYKRNSHNEASHQPNKNIRWGQDSVWKRNAQPSPYGNNRNSIHVVQPRPHENRSITRDSAQDYRGQQWQNHNHQQTHYRRQWPQRRSWHIRSENSVEAYVPATNLVPPPPPPLRQVNYDIHRQDFKTEDNFAFRVPTTTTPRAPTIGPSMGDLLKLPSDTIANTDNVPSFAAKKFVIREAPLEFYPPDYKGRIDPHRPKYGVEISRTKFYCEEQKYLPGIYADPKLGCKMFHLCVPSSVGSTLSTYLCPNGTLFDQSILQCNYWYFIDCEDSIKHYDANLALALSYRRINAAHLSLHSSTNANSLSLLSQNIDQFQTPSKDTTPTISRRMGRVLREEENSSNSIKDNSLFSKNTNLLDKNINSSNIAFNSTSSNLIVDNVYSDPLKSVIDLVISIRKDLRNKRKNI